MSAGAAVRTDRTALVRFAVSAVVALLLVDAVITAAGGLSDALGQLRHSDPVWFPEAVLLEVAFYCLFGLQLLRISGPTCDLPWSTATRISLVVYGLGNLLPAAPAEGIALSISELKRRGMSAHRAGLMLVLAQWVQFWALVLIFAIDRLVAAAAGDLRGRGALAVIGGSALLVAITATAIILVRRRATAERVALLTRWLPGQRDKTTEELRAAGSSWYDDLQELLGPGSNRLLVALLAMGAWMADAGCMWLMLRSVHVHVGLEIVLIAYAAGVVATWVPFLPAGIGAVEVAVPAVLHHFGVPVAAGLAGTLLWRAVSTFLPALGGMGAYLSLRAQHLNAYRS
jgi:Mg2+-importing ATPase